MGAYSSAVLATSGLAGYWRLDETSGTAFSDTKGSATLYSTGSPSLGIVSRVGGDGYSIGFNGTTTALSGTVAITAVNNFSLECWVFPTAFPTSGFVTPFYVGTSSNGYGFAFGSDGTFNLLYETVAFGFRSTQRYTPGRWYYLVATRGATGAPSMYVNGTAITGTTRTSAPNTPTLYTTIGAERKSDGSYGGFFNGIVDEVAAYTGVLSANDIGTHYALGVATSYQLSIGTANLVDMVDFHDLTVTDSGPNAVGRLRATIRNPSLVAIPTGGDVTITNGLSVSWVGTLASRALRPAYGGGNEVEIEAADLSATLDRIFVASETIPDGSTDRAAIQQLAAYGTSVGLTAPDATVDKTKDDLVDVYVENKTLREALQVVADSTISIDPSGVEWSARTLPVAQTYTGIVYNGTDKWIGVASNGGTVISSLDTFTWSTAATAIYATSLAYGNGLYVAGGGNATIGAGTTARIYSSANGTSWSNAAAGTVYPNTYLSLVTTDAPLAYYRLGDASGTVATAAIGTSGTYAGTPTLGTAGALADDSNTAVYFSGTATQTMKASTVATGATSFSIEAWVKPGATSQEKLILYNGQAGANGYGFYHTANPGAGTKLHVLFEGVLVWDSGYTFSDTNWHHLALTRTGGTARVYVDGTATANTNTSTPGAPSGGNLVIGPYNGSVDEFAVYNYALGSAAIAAHYAAGTSTRHGAPTWGDLAYGTAGWIAVGADYTSGYIAKSTSGTASWSVTNAYSGTALHGVTYGDGRYVAVGDVAILTSTNGTAWTSATTSPTLGTALLGVATDGTAFVAVGPSGTIYRASSGTATFTKQAAPSTDRLESVTWWPDASLWVAVGAADTTFTSPDGLTWTAQTSSTFGQLTTVTQGAQKIIAVGGTALYGSDVQDERPRTFYIDELNRLHYGITGATAAPYAISSSPDGTATIAPEQLEIDYDESGIVNRVWVASAASDALYSGWVEDATSIATYGPRESYLVNELATTASRAERYGRAYLATRKDPVTRGMFTVTGYDGWKAGQNVTITYAPLSLSATEFSITQVETEWLTGDTRRYRVSFGALPRSLVNAIASGS